ncbi:MAG: lysophospholipid acyltransferase family protein, partial [Bacteriovoracales bacterium]|nr:lysophospholipid acyltransferase family protein [Bacteriovoracales bacterium]
MSGSMTGSMKGFKEWFVSSPSVLFILLLFPFSFLLNLLGRSFSHGIGYALVRLAFFPRRFVIRSNIDQAFRQEKTGTQKRELERSFYLYFGKFVGDFIGGLTCTKRQLRKRIAWDHGALEEMKRIYDDEGKSIIFVTGHTGNFQLLGLALATYFPVIIPIKRQSNPWFHLLGVWQRKKYGFVGLYPGEVMRGLEKGFRQKKVFGFALDQHYPGRGGVSVTFFGRPCKVLGLPASLAKKKNIRVFAVSIFYGDKGLSKISDFKEYKYQEILHPGPKSREAQKVTARTSSKNCNKGKVTVLHPDKIGRRQRGATEACFLHVAGKRRGSR